MLQRVRHLSDGKLSDNQFRIICKCRGGSDLNKKVGQFYLTFNRRTNMNFEKILMKAAIFVNNRIIRFTLWGIYVVLLLLHNYTLKGLERPAGLSEAFIFLFKDPSSYMLAFICGLLAYPVPIILFISLIVSYLIKVLDIQDGYYYDNRIDNNIKLWEYIIILVVVIAMIILNHLFISYVFLLGLALVVLFGVIYSLLNNN